MNHRNEFDVYLQLESDALGDRESSSAAAPAQRERMQQEISMIAAALRTDTEPLAEDQLLIRRIQQTLNATQTAQTRRDRLPRRIRALAAAFLVLVMLGSVWHWRHNPEPAIALQYRAPIVRQHLQGQEQLLLLVEHQPQRFKTQAALAQELLGSQAALRALAVRSGDAALRQHCEQVETVLRLIAHLERPLPESLRAELRERDLAFHARALARSPIQS